MSRRAALPGAEELFRTVERGRPGNGGRRPSGRQRHEEKITVYLSEAELIDLERTKLELRQHYQLGVDRGRIVREALAAVLAEFETAGADSSLVRRLQAS